MSRKLKIYITSIISLAVLFLGVTFNMAKDIDIIGVIFFTMLSIIIESLLIVTPGNRTVSMGFIVNLVVIILFNVPEVMWITGIGIMLRTFKNNGSRLHIFNYPFYKTLFNGANIVLTTGVSALLFQNLSGNQQILNLRMLTISIIPSILVYIIVNAIIISILMTILNNKSFFITCYDNIIWVVRDYAILAPISIVMALAYRAYGVVGVVLFLGPLLAARISFKLYVDMKNIYIETVKALSQAVEAKDPYTQGHSMRVSQYSVDIARELKLSQKRIDNLRIAAILHDIGKIGVEENILNKQGQLTNEEFLRIKLHPTIGVKIIKEIDFLKDVANIILAHHERIDGKGYPLGIKGAEIHLESCILSIADVYDALTSDRPYRKAMDKEKALQIIEEGSGSQFNPKVVEAFIKIINSRETIKNAG